MSRQQLWRIIKGGFVKGGVKDPGLITVQRIVRALDWPDEGPVRRRRPHADRPLDPAYETHKE